MHILALVIIAFAAMSGCGCHAPVSVPDSVRALQTRYNELARRAVKYNDDADNMNYWSLNAEHCFGTDRGVTESVDGDGNSIHPDALRECIVEFVQQPETPYLLFEHLLRNRNDSSAVLVDAEMLMFYTQFTPPRSDSLSGSVNAVKCAVKSGAFAEASRRYPYARISDNILAAIEHSEQE